MVSRRHQPLILRCLLSLFVLAQQCHVHAFLIVPGTGLESARARKGDLGAVQVVVFEHTEHGTGGLVLNKPAPILIRDIPSPRFQAFGTNSLMLGCGMESSGDGGRDGVALGDMSPWFWLHDIANIPGSFELPGAQGPLYMGGNIDVATERVEAEGIDTRAHFQFFWKYRLWKAGELEKELEEGRWIVQPQDPQLALQASALRLI